MHRRPFARVRVLAAPTCVPMTIASSRDRRNVPRPARSRSSGGIAPPGWPHDCRPRCGHSSSRLRSSRNCATASSSPLPAGLAAAFSAAGAAVAFLEAAGRGPRRHRPEEWHRCPPWARPRRIRSRIPPPRRRRRPRRRRCHRACRSAGCAAAHRLAERGHAQGHRADGQLVADLQGLLAQDPLAIDEGAVGTAEVAHGQLAVDVVDLAMPPADLRRLDADDTIIVAPEAGDPFGQLERRRGAPAPHDLKYIIHRGFVPIRFTLILGDLAEMG